MGRRYLKADLISNDRIRFLDDSVTIEAQEGKTIAPRADAEANEMNFRVM
jgi:hypothetical protein